MKTDVYAFLEESGLGIKSNSDVKLKFILFLSGMVVPYLLMLTQIATGFLIPLLCLVLVFSTVFFMLNCLHDIMHGSFSYRPFVKKRICYLLDVIGASSFIWKIKHNISHHTYTNHSTLDNDIDVSKILRFSAYQTHRPIHRIQHLYISLVYFLQCFFWFYISDFKNILRQRIGTKPMQSFQGDEKFFFFFNKILHLTISLVLPAIVFGLKNALIAYILIYGLLGFLLALIFQAAHIFVDTEYHQVERFENQDHWARIQIASSCAFAVDSRIGYWLYGGLQFQVLHHLFPDICHNHFQSIFHIVQKHCERNRIKLTVHSSLYSAVRSHYRQLYLLGQVRSLADRETEPNLL